MRTSHPMISVIMGTYNEKNREYVKIAIDSILTQTYGDFEFIICDDGSEEEYWDWLQMFCNKDQRIRLYRNEVNKGLASVLNFCIQVAKGKYIARMDADDISKKERLEKQISFLEEHQEYALVGCTADMFDDSGVWGHRGLDEVPTEKSFLSTNPFIHPSIMIRYDVVKILKGYRDISYTKRVEDYDFFMRLYANKYKGYNIQEALFMYREDSNAFKKRKYIYRINEAFVRFVGFKNMHILVGNVKYVIRPLIVGLLPLRGIKYIHKKKFG